MNKLRTGDEIIVISGKDKKDYKNRLKEYFKNISVYQSNELIESLNTTQEVKRIMKAVKREHFVKDGYIHCDKPLLTIENQTISAPHMHAKALEYLFPMLKEGSEVLI